MRTTIFLVALMTGAITAEPLDIPKEQFRSKEFIKGFVGAFGFLSPVEPKVDQEEGELLVELSEMFADGRFREAEAEIVNFIKLRKNPVEEGVQPKDVSAALVFQLAQLYYMNGRNDDAERAYKLAIERHPDFRRAHKYLALLYAGDDRISDALPHLKRTVALGEADHLIYGLLGYAYTQDGKPLAAEGAYRQAYLLNPDEDQWKSGLALTLYQQEKWTEASAMLGELLSDKPDSAEFWKMQANCYLNMEDQLRAATNFEVLRLKNLADEATLNTLGDIYTNQQKPLLALGAYLGALEKSKEVNVKRSLEVAKALADYGAPRESAKYIGALRERGVKLNRDEQISLKLTELIIAKESNDDASVGKLLEDLLALDPMNGEALVENGLYYEKLADSASDETEATSFRTQAKAQFKLAMNSSLEEIRYSATRSYGQMLVRQREYIEALEYLQKAVDLKPSDNLRRFVRQVSVFADKQKERDNREAAEQEAARKEREEKKANEENEKNATNKE